MIDDLPPLSPDPIIEAYKRDVDLSLLRENLKLTVEQRLQKLIEHQQFARGLRDSVVASPANHE